MDTAFPYCQSSKAEDTDANDQITDTDANDQIMDTDIIEEYPDFFLQNNQQPRAEEDFWAEITPRYNRLMSTGKKTTHCTIRYLTAEGEFLSRHRVYYDKEKKKLYYIDRKWKYYLPEEVSHRNCFRLN